ALLALIGSALFFAVKRLASPSGEETESFSWMVGLGTLASFVALVTSLFLYTATFTTWFVFWVLLAGLSILIGKEVKTVSLAPPSFLALISSFVFLVSLIFGLGLLFLGGQKYIAEVQYLKAVQASQDGKQDEAIQKVLRAVQLNPSSDLYWRDLAQLYLNQVNTISQNTSLTAEERQKALQDAVNNAVASALQTTLLSPENVANWNVQGFVYQNLIGIQGAEDLATEAYQKASELDPSSPYSLTELARVYILQADRLAQQQGLQDQRSQALQNALDQLNKAIGLKNDYSPAHYLIAAVYDKQGNSEQATRKLEELKIVNPNDIGLAFQLGMVYWQKDNVEKAQAEFLRAKALNPQYANGLYMLGLTYDKQGKKDLAKEAFRAVLQLNPDSEEIKHILANLDSGKQALNGLTPAQPPVKEGAPPEIKKE
ncbi:MAG: tetratricopeptide repeat protein, partial [bacterium]|nr:tetratricopeptide repeat protein [bacterium]